MTEDYLEQLKRERSRLLERHTSLVVRGYPGLAEECWDAVMRVNKQISKTEGKGGW